MNYNPLFLSLIGLFLCLHTMIQVVEAWKPLTYTATYRRILTSRQRSMAKYNRIYSQLRLGKFYYYHRLYRYNSRIVHHYILTYKSEQFNCGNFEANEFDDYMGYEKCPQDFEPRNFTYCCGSTYYNYCCDDIMRKDPSADTIDDEPTTLTGGIIAIIIIGSLGFIGFLIGGIGALICYCANSSRHVRPVGGRGVRGQQTQVMTTVPRPGVFVSSATGVQPAPPFPAPPEYAAPPYPQQQTLYSPANQEMSTNPGASFQPQNDLPPPYPGLPPEQQSKPEFSFQENAAGRY